MYWACKTSRATSAHPGGMLLAHAHLTCNIFEVPMHSGGIICPDSDDDGLSTHFLNKIFNLEGTQIFNKILKIIGQSQVVNDVAMDFTKIQF